MGGGDEVVKHSCKDPWFDSESGHIRKSCSLMITFHASFLWSGPQLSTVFGMSTKFFQYSKAKDLLSDHHLCQEAAKSQSRSHYIYIYIYEIS